MTRELDPHTAECKCGKVRNTVKHQHIFLCGIFSPQSIRENSLMLWLLPNSELPVYVFGHDTTLLMRCDSPQPSMSTSSSLRKRCWNKNAGGNTKQGGVNLIRTKWIKRNGGHRSPEWMKKPQVSTVLRTERSARYAVLHFTRVSGVNETPLTFNTWHFSLLSEL